MNDQTESGKPLDFIRQIVDEDQKSAKHPVPITRFPPEPNGFLHIGHAKSICLNFGISNEYGGICHLRFDDTNPSKEEAEYVQSIQEDVRWLGFDWQDHLYFASDYFEQLYTFAEELINRGKAYVCELTGDEIRQYRGTLTEPGKKSPYRDRSVSENLDLFRKMKSGEFSDGSRVLRTTTTPLFAALVSTSSAGVVMLPSPTPAITRPFAPFLIAASIRSALMPACA